MTEGAVMRLLDDGEWKHWSDREIAERCAVSDEFVRTERSCPLAWYSWR